jgi:hypothetical protein
VTLPILGNSFESFVPLPASLALQFSQLGTRFIRLFEFWNTINPQKGKFVWDKPDADISAVLAAKMDPYFDFLWAPEWVCGGFPTYLPYTAGCSTYNKPHDGGFHFCEELCGDNRCNHLLGKHALAEDDPDRPCGETPAGQPCPCKKFTATNICGLCHDPLRQYCVHPPSIDPAATFDFGHAAAQRYGNKVAFWGAWNEPGGQTYWPSRAYGYPTFQALGNEVIAPFTAGVRSVLPDAKFIGIEAASHGECGDLLRFEAEEAGTKLFDVIGIHTYASNDGDQVANAFKRIDDDYLPMIAPHRNGREVWVTEMGFDGYPADVAGYVGKQRRWMQGLSDRGIARASFHGIAQWFQPGVIDPNYGTLALGKTERDYAFSDIGRDMQRENGKTGRRRHPAVDEA